MEINAYYEQSFPDCMGWAFDAPLAISGHDSCSPRLHLTMSSPEQRFISLFCGQNREQLSAAANPLAEHLPKLLEIVQQQGVEYPLVTPVYIYTTFDVDENLATYIKNTIGAGFDIMYRTPVYAQQRDSQQSLIESFLQKYATEYLPAFELVTTSIRRQLEADLKAQNILAIVSSRTKALDSLRQKLWKRALAPDGTLRKNYQNEEDIFCDLADLSGLRVALYFPGDRERTSELVAQRYKCLEVKNFPEDAVKPNYAKRFSGYWAKHVRVSITEAEAGLNDKDKERVFRAEIQIGSVIMHAWSEVEHDLLYKQQKGTPSLIEAQLLDELNGLAIAGEIILEHLQLVYRQRMQELENRIAQAKMTAAKAQIEPPNSQ